MLGNVILECTQCVQDLQLLHLKFVYDDLILGPRSSIFYPGPALGGAGGGGGDNFGRLRFPVNLGAGAHLGAIGPIGLRPALLLPINSSRAQIFEATLALRYRKTVLNVMTSQLNLTCKTVLRYCSANFKLQIR